MRLDNFTEEKREILNSITEVIKEKMINVISTSINEDIKLEKSAEGILDKVAIQNSIGNTFVHIKFEFKEGFKGELDFLITKSTVAQIVDKMLMGEGDAEFDEGEHLEAIEELTNQILGATATELTGLFEFSVSFSPAKSRVMEFSYLDSTITEEELMSQLSVTILDASDIFIVTHSSTFDNIIDKISGSTDDDVMAQQMEDSLDIPTIGANMIGEVSGGKDLGLLMDVRLPISVELGRKKMFIRDILKLTPGEVVNLPKLQGEPVDLYVNNKKFAVGEVVVLGENFGVRIKDLITPKERLKESDAWVDGVD